MIMINDPCLCLSTPNDPCLSMTPYEDEEDAIRTANDTL
jgi:hypothetical protein